MPLTTNSIVLSTYCALPHSILRHSKTRIPRRQYDSIASPTSGLSDYFARLSDAYDDDEDSDDPSSSRGRVDVPLTPGARVNRSMDVSRSWVPLGAQLHG
jgi:hypothetical protein